MSKRIVADRQRKQIQALDEKLSISNTKFATLEKRYDEIQSRTLMVLDFCEHFVSYLNEINGLFETPAETFEGIPAVVRAFVEEAKVDRERLRELQARLLGPEVENVAVHLDGEKVSEVDVRPETP